MDVATYLAIDQRDEGSANEHVSKADAKKKSTLVYSFWSESRDMEWIGHKRLG
jgi:hypothetical protein